MLCYPELSVDCHLLEKLSPEELILFSYLSQEKLRKEYIHSYEDLEDGDEDEIKSGKIRFLMKELKKRLNMSIPTQRRVMKSLARKKFVKVCNFEWNNSWTISVVDIETSFGLRLKEIYSA